MNKAAMKAMEDVNKISFYSLLGVSLVTQFRKGAIDYVKAFLLPFGSFTIDVGLRCVYKPII